jgi:hypothetical protein
VKPLKSVVQLHGIVIVKAAGDDAYRRIGYFWTADMKTVGDIIASKEQPDRIWLI